MPDFPSRKGATPAEVWAYATRGLSTPADYKANVTGLAPAGEYDGEMAAIEGKVDTVDTVVDGVKTQTDLLPADPASESGDIKTVVDAIPILTEIEGSAVIATQAKQDIIDGVVDDIKPKTDNLPDDPASESGDIKTETAAIKTRADKIPGYEAPVEASIEMLTATEVTLVEKTDDKIGILDGYVDLTPMEAGDTVVIRQSMQIKAAGDYVQYAEDTYSDVQTLNPLLHIITKTAKDKIKVTAEQTVGTVKTFDVQFYRRLQA